MPLQAWRAKGKNPSGKYGVVFKLSEGYADKPLQLPCGQCIGCRLERSRQWAMRCLHEASTYTENCFLTLTYDQQHIPADGSISVREMQLFIKKLRKEFADETKKRTGTGIRFFQCGEYGDQFGRPHYHALIFNFDFKDKTLFKVTNQDHHLYASPTLNRIWGKGHALIGDVTFESAAYVARYIMKKITGDDAAEHYKGKTPEFVTMSRRPGIGKTWYDKYKSDVYPHDHVVMRGQKMKPPKYYDSQFEIDDPIGFFKIKTARTTTTEAKRLDNDSFRLPVKETVKKAKLKLLIRELHNGND